MSARGQVARANVRDDISMPSALADSVLPLIRTRADLHRWSASNAHASQMYEAVDLLEQAADSGAAPAEVLDVTRRGLESGLKISLRADDSSGIIGDAIRRLYDLHPASRRWRRRRRTGWWTG